MVARRDFLASAASLAAWGLTSLQVLATAATRRRLVLVLLRGGMDGLSAVPAFADPHWLAVRAQPVVPAPGAGGGALPFDSGWLNRALALLQDAGKSLGVVLNRHMPLLLRGAVPVTSWSPSLLAPPQRDTISRLAALYRDTDPAPAMAFEIALRGNAMTRGPRVPAGGPIPNTMASGGRFSDRRSGARWQGDRRLAGAGTGAAP